MGVVREGFTRKELSRQEEGIPPRPEEEGRGKQRFPYFVVSGVQILHIQSVALPPPASREC